MAISLKHTTQAAGTDAGNGEIRKAQWNEEHALTMATGKLLGRSTASPGAAEEITPGSGLTLANGVLSATDSGSAVDVLIDGTVVASAVPGIEFRGSDFATSVNSDGSVNLSLANPAGSPSTRKLFVVFRPMDNEPSTSNFATLDTRNNHPVLDFDTTTQETAIFSGVLSPAYAGGGLIVEVWWAATSATSGTIGWDVAFERIDESSLDIDSDSFASAQTITAATVPGTSGQVKKTSVTVTDGANMDSLAAGEAFRLRVRRDVANDTATGDAELLRVVVREP
jgi:hypothetical protein